MQKPKPKGFGVMIAIGKPKGDMPPRPRSLERPDEDDSVSSRNHSQESPEDERKYHEEGGSVAPTPESVCYHDGSEGCGACEYFSEGQCKFLQMPVDENGWCKRFESKKEDQQPEEVNESDTEDYPA